MKYLIAFLSVYMILTSCNNVKERTVYIDEIPIEECKMQSHSLPPVLIFPQSINSFQDKIIVLEPKRKDSIVSVFSSSDFNCIYSGLSKGHAKHELIDPRKDYFAKNDSSFYILDYNIEKEYKIDGQNQLKYLGYKAFSFPDILNKMVRVGSNKHISAGFTSGEGEEHLLWENGNYHGFGEYPTTSCRNEECFFYNGKHTAGVIGKDKIWDFYMYQDLIRSYDLDGNLLENIKIINRNKNTKKKVIKIMRLIFGDYNVTLHIL